MSKHFPDRYPKQPRDFYPTPRVSVEPLIPFLKAAKVRDFCEPCAGEGDLVRHLESFGLRCVYSGDIASGQDALDIERFAAPVITNPPFSRQSTKLLLALIAHFLHAAPCAWLLLPLDRASNRNMRPFLPHCSHIVIAGRDRWLDNGQSGTADLAWFRFDREHYSGPVLHNGDGMAGCPAVRRCVRCGRVFQPSRCDARYCGGTCRKQAQRDRLLIRGEPWRTVIKPPG